MESMVHEAAAAHGMDLDLSKAISQMYQVYTLDEALDYFKSLKAIQEKFDANGFPEE